MEIEVYNGNPRKICNLIKVKNVQQADNVISGIKYDKYSGAREMFCVYTDDKKYQKLYTYSEVNKVLEDLLDAGYISYSEYFGTDENGNCVKDALKNDLEEYLLAISEDDYKGICYCREELAWYQEKLCIIHGSQMHWQGKDLPAFRYLDGSMDNRMAAITLKVGDVESFKKDVKPFVEGFPVVQLIFAYYLSGAIRQILSKKNEGVGEFGLVTCITGKPASGKTTVTTTLLNILFGKDAGRLVSNNVTSKGLYNIIRNSGICPVVRDDSSTDLHNNMSSIEDKVYDIYNIASGKCRITANSNVDFPLYAPFIESREGDWGLSDMLKPIRRVEGYKYRILEVFCQQGDLTKDGECAHLLASLSGKYSGMAVDFLNYLVDTYSENEVYEMYCKYLNEMCKKLQESNLESRYANRTAVITTTAHICMEAYGIQMNIDEIEQVMIQSISAFERRIIASPENYELALLYKFISEKTSDGHGVNDEFIADTTRNYRHQKHYIAFQKGSNDEFYIPKLIIEYMLTDIKPCPPSFWKYDKYNRKTESKMTESRRWKAIEKAWVEMGILIIRSGQNTCGKSVKLDGVWTTCYHFSWKKIAQQFGDDMPIDITRFVHDDEQEIEDSKYDF